jgi:hypothetical protein
MSDVGHEKIPTKYKLGDHTPKGVVNCVLASRHEHGSRYLIDGKYYTEQEIDA